MSIYFVTSDGRDLWNPSSFTAQLFCDQAESIARHLGVDSGLGPIVSDAVVVSELSFVSFAQSFAVQLSQVDPESGAHALLEVVSQSWVRWRPNWASSGPTMRPPRVWSRTARASLVEMVIWL